MLTRRISASLVLLYLGAAAVGLGVAYGGGLFTNKTQSSSLYTITLVETMNQWPSNTSLSQPAFYLLGSNGLQLLTTLSLPANRMIQLTIVSYDMPTPGTNAQEGMVTGTVGNNMYLMNGTIATYGNATWGRSVSSVQAATIAHTFTVQQLGLNIPIVGGSTVVTNLYFTKTGPYTWICLTPCGYPYPPGTGDAMSMAGWMTGQLMIQ